MKKTTKFITLLLSLLLVLSILPLSTMAFGEADHNLIITHFNNGSVEGAGVILSPALGPTVGGDYAWWTLVTFDWDSTDLCYKVTRVQPTNDGQNKSNTTIPTTGFVYAVNTGNDYPALYASTHNEAFNNKPNYVTTNVMNSYTYAAKLTVGTKAYLYNADLANSEFETNGGIWYTGSYVSKAYIKIGTPDTTGYLYNPINPTELILQRTLKPTMINTYGDAAGMSILYTKAYGNDIFGTHTGTDDSDFAWWKTATFEWNDVQSCYVVSSVNLSIGNNYPKQAVIPENGFVLAVCTDTSNSSDPTLTTYGNMDKLKIGAKAYLYNANLSTGTINADTKICVNISDEALTAVAPILSGPRLTAPTLTNMTTSRTVAHASGFTIEWTPVPGATGYIVNVNNATFTTDGTLIVNNVSVSAGIYSIPNGKLEVGNIYKVSVYAIASGRTSSLVTKANLYVAREDAYTNSLRDKTIVAFGDSLTARTGWATLLGGSLGMDLINAGVGGDTSTQGRARFQKQVLEQNPDIVIINFGMNDQAQLVTQNKPLNDLATYTANLEYFASTLIAAGSEVVFVTPNPVCTSTGYYSAGAYNLNYGTTNILAYCEAMKQVAMKYDCGIVDINYECSKLDITAICAAGDGIHQSIAGHQLYADLIGDYLLAVNTQNSTALSTVTVNYVDAENQPIATASTLNGAIGASVLVPGAKIEGYTLTSTATSYLFTSTAGTITFHYTEEVKQIETLPTSDFEIVGDTILLNSTGLTSAAVLEQIQTADVTCILKSGSFVGTGSVLQLKSGETVLQELTVIVKGDASGDGKITATDYLFAKRHFLGTYTLTNEYLAATDIDGNGSITATDYLKIKRHVLGTFDIFA